MLIGIDASRYGGELATGVEHYSYKIINGLLKEISKSKDDKAVLYAKKSLGLSEAGKVAVKVIDRKRLWTMKGLSKEMKEHPSDVLFVPSHVLPKTLPEKSVIMIHDVAFKYLRKAYSWMQYRYLDWSTKFAVQNATTILVPSEATKSDLMHFYKCPEEKIEVVYHGFDPLEVSSKEIDKVYKESDVFKYFGIRRDSKYVFFVGRLESKKNLEKLVEAFYDFSQTHEDFRLVLAGTRGVGADRIIKKVRKLRMADKVVIPGYITDPEKAALYKYCSVFAFPSLYEGFGFPVLEAFHFDKPVLTSHVSCLPEVAGDAAHYVDPYDPDSIAMGLEKLVDDTGYAEKLVSLGKERLKEFTWEKASKQTYKILTS
ncbi:glycosyltransferase family 4 protein [Candidatus Peregrinibacteria bacterium]|jgi:glycosyltransferase involved in cell wall biosynthesis|nr:glycosyltransferase family 4 protein [Candidatus Peregrinibacteria bacterium]MBT7736224.1 glycosyltransferase family 4 protein [Candidatus Peregrinibacteria bacterium]